MGVERRPAQPDRVHILMSDVHALDGNQPLLVVVMLKYVTTREKMVM